MANIVISSICNLNCPYCFAKDHLDKKRKSNPQSSFISIEAFQHFVDFLDRSGIEEARLLGGEPTLHPKFDELVRIARSRHKKVLLFSHGLIAEHVLSLLESLPPEECAVLINTNASRTESGPDPEEQQERVATMKRLGQKAYPGYTIYQISFSLDQTLSLIQESGCQPKIRIGLAQPSFSANNRCVHPRFYPLVGRKLTQYAIRASREGIRIEFDCGFVRCMFSDDQILSLKLAEAEIAYHCNPILDIGIDGTIIHCFPLAEKIQMRLQTDSNATSLREEMVQNLSPFRSAGIYKECSTCTRKSLDECTGGCLASTIQRFHSPSFQINFF